MKEKPACVFCKCVMIKGDVFFKCDEGHPDYLVTTKLYEEYEKTEKTPNHKIS